MFVPRRTWSRLIGPAALLVVHSLAAQVNTGAGVNLPPGGYGSLTQDNIALRINTPDIGVRFVPLDARVTRLLAKDSWESLRSLVESRRVAIDSVAHAAGVSRPGLALVSFFGQRDERPLRSPDTDGEGTEPRVPSARHRAVQRPLHVAAARRARAGQRDLSVRGGSAGERLVHGALRWAAVGRLAEQATSCSTASAPGWPPASAPSPATRRRRQLAGLLRPEPIRRQVPPRRFGGRRLGALSAKEVRRRPGAGHTARPFYVDRTGLTVQARTTPA